MMKMITMGRYYNHCRMTLRWVSHDHHQWIRVVDGRSMSSFSFRPHFTPPPPPLLPLHYYHNHNNDRSVLVSSLSFSTDTNETTEDDHQVDVPKHKLTPWAEQGSSNRHELNLMELAHVVEQVLYHMAHESKYQKATDNPQRLVRKSSPDVTTTDTTDSIDTRAYILELAASSTQTALATQLRQVLMAVPHALDHIANTVSWFDFDDAASVAALAHHHDEQDTTAPSSTTNTAPPPPPGLHIKRTIRRTR